MLHAEKKREILKAGTKRVRRCGGRRKQKIGLRSGPAGLFVANENPYAGMSGYVGCRAVESVFAVKIMFTISSQKVNEPKLVLRPKQLQDDHSALVVDARGSVRLAEGMWHLAQRAARQGGGRL